MGRPLSISKTFTGNPAVYTTRNDYDLASNLLAMTYPVDGYRVDYGYHPGTRLLKRVRGMDGIEFAELEDYSPDGKIGYIYQGNGTATTFSYDPTSTRLSAIRIQAPNVDPGSDLFHKTYRYSPAGDIKEITDQLKSVTRYYGYDKLHRLISETSSNTALVHPSRVVRLTYDYQGAGPFHAPKRITARGRTHELQYDANGNMAVSPNLTDPGALTYRRITYTADNMPSRIDQPNAKCPEALAGAPCPTRVDFVYDGGNERGRKASTAGSTYFIGKHFEVVNSVPTRYIFAGNLRLAKVTPSGVLHFHKDHLTSTAAVSNAAGEKIDSADYIPFGQERNHSGQRVTHYKYTDQELDSETGLYNYKARLYDPVSAVFISSDPYLSPNFVFDLIQGPNSLRGQRNFSSVGDKPGNRARTSATKALVDFFSNTSQRLDRYAYVQNNPINFVDSSGLWSEPIHNKIIKEAFKHLPESQRNQIEKGSAFADTHQDKKFNHMHAMSQKGESAESANSKMQDYINEHMNNYTTLKETGQFEKAYFELGMALHPIMDSTSPFHEGFQVWEGILNNSGYNLAKHWLQERNISNDQVAKTVQRMKEAMDK